MSLSPRTCVILGVLLAVLILTVLGVAMEGDLNLSGQGEWTGQ